MLGLITTLGLSIVAPTMEAEAQENINIAVFSSDHAKREFNRQCLIDITDNIKDDLNEKYMSEPIEIAADTLEGLYGIENYMYESFYGEQSRIENSVDTFIIIKCTDEFREEVQNLFNDYKLKVKYTESVRNQEKYENSIIRVQGEYVIFSVLGTYKLQDYKEVNKIAVDRALESLDDLPKA